MTLAQLKSGITTYIKTNTTKAITGNLLQTWMINIVDYFTPTYTVYTALISQSNTNAPTVIILENTIGNIVWSYNSTGSYFATLLGAFPIDKTFAISNSSITNRGRCVIFDIDNINGNRTVNVLEINTYTGSTGASLVDNNLRSTPIEIRIYN